LFFAHYRLLHTFDKLSDHLRSRALLTLVPMKANFVMAVLLLLILSACTPAVDFTEPITITRDGLSLTVDPQLGGRITSLTLNGKEVLKTSRDELNLQWGSTAWTSPQSDWEWPPIATFDSEPFTMDQPREHVLLLESARDSATLLRMIKRITLGPDSDVGITYWITNEGGSSVQVAAWENTRLPYAGYIEFQSDSLRGDQDTLPVSVVDSTYVIHFDDRHTERQKVFADLATDSVTYYGNGIRFCKYTAITNLFHTPPGQAPLEVYFDPAAGFMEFELHGYYRRIEPKASADLRVRWKIEAL